MGINVSSIKTSICSIPKKTSKEAQKVGKAVISFKNNIKERCSKSDVFQKGIFKRASEGKETLIGYGVFIAASILAIKCIKGIVDKIKETKKE